MAAMSNPTLEETVSVDTGTSVVEAARLMKARNVTRVLVASRSQVIGVVTESDIVKKFVGADRAIYFVPVEEIMSSLLPTELTDQIYRRSL